MRRELEADPEFLRIDQIPRRALTTGQVEYLATYYTNHLRTPYGTQRLRPVQAQAIHEGITARGVFGPVGCGLGKAVASCTQVLTSDGWVAARDVRVGSMLIGFDGKPTRTLGVFPQGERPCYRLTFSDGTSNVVDDDHLWTFNYRTRGEQTFRTGDLAASPLKTKAGAQYALALVEPVHFERSPRALTLDPWLLGMWLGDGNNNRICKPEQDLLDRLHALWPESTIVHQAERCPHIALRAGFKAALGPLGECKSEAKYIPDSFLRASVPERIALLQGLFDSDGHVSESGNTIEYATSSARLIDDIVDLVRGLGGICTVGTRTPRFTYKGEKKSGQRSYRIHARFPRNDFVPVSSAKHLARWTGKRQRSHKYLKSIERVEPQETVCFLVECPRHLFVIEGYNLTHNTLISLLLPVAVGLKKPLLVVPAHLKRKTTKEMPDISQHWKLHDCLTIRSYSELAIESRVGELEELEPDGIICDEAHKLKNQSAAVTRRVARYLEAHRDCRLYVLSGTLLTNDLDDLAHLAAWSLRERSPYPYLSQPLATWKAMLNGSLMNEVDPGPMRHWPYDGERAYDVTDFARRAVRKRALDTEGVVAASTGEEYEGTITVRALEVPPTPLVHKLYKSLREEWLTPDGWSLISPLEIWSKARELALGLHYMWDPRPPEDWLAARGKYAFFARTYLDNNVDKIDTEKQMRTALEKGELTDPLLVAAWQGWESIKGTFVVNPTLVWHDDSALKACAAWAKKGPGIVWTSHRYFAEKLAEVSGLAYYGTDAEDSKTGRHVMDHSPKESLIASVESCGTGQNLQAWARNLWTAPRGKSPEQLLARTHRPGQTKDEVVFDVLVGCREHLESIPNAVQHALMIVATVPNATQKILRADIEWPDDLHERRGHAWAFNRSKPVTSATLEDLFDDEEESND